MQTVPFNTVNCCNGYWRIKHNKHHGCVTKAAHKHGRLLTCLERIIQPMDQLDRRTKLLIVGGVFLLLVIGIIVLAVSCSAARKREPEPTPVVDISPIPESTPAPTQSPAPTVTPSPTPEAVTAPELPEASPIPVPETAAPTSKPTVVNLSCQIAAPIQKRAIQTAPTPSPALPIRFNPKIQLPLYSTSACPPPPAWGHR